MRKPLAAVLCARMGAPPSAAQDCTLLLASLFNADASARKKPALMQEIRDWAREYAAGPPAAAPGPDALAWLHGFAGRAWTALSP